MPHQLLFRPLLLGTLLIALTACAPFASDKQRESMEVPARTISTPSGFYGGIAWVDDWIVASLDTSTEPKAFTERIWRFHSDGSNAEQVPLPEVEGCDRQGFYAPVRLPNQRLGYIVNCFRQSDSALADLLLMAYDVQTKQTTPLLPYPLPTQIAGVGFSWNPGMSRGIMGDGNTLYGTLYWLDATQPVTVDIDVSVAYAPEWSPDGTRIAFVGAPSQSLKVEARFGSFLNLYLMQPDGT